MRIIRTLATTMLSLAMLGSTGLAAPSPPPTLGSGSDFTLFELLTGEIDHLEGLCQPSGQTFTFDASGVATGPYPGTFTETGRVTISPPSGTALFNARVIGFESAFRIETTFEGSPAEITGTKRLAFEGLGHCADVEEGSPFRSSRIFIVLVDYEARIKTHRGVFHDRGSSDVRLSEFFEPEDPSQGQWSFSELFISELGPEAAKPGRGCGDDNHVHLRESECRMRD